MSVWKSVGTGIWIRVYSFGGNPINTSVVDMGDGGLMAISPGTDVGDADFAALDELGTVKALVVPGAFHNMGLPVWFARYPDAEIYGPADCIAHVAKQHKDIPAVQPLNALAAKLPDGCELEEVAGMKYADLFLAIKQDDGTTWFTNEIVTNNEAYPGNFMFKLAFQLTGSGPGLNVNKLAMMLVRGKKAQIRSYLEGKLDSVPPTRLVPTHGIVLDDANLADQMREMFARRL